MRAPRVFAWTCVMDCQTFDLSLLDALYDELDAGASRAMDEHAAACETCATRFARLRKMRELVGPSLEAPLPSGLETRILAAAEAAMDAAAAPAASVALDPPVHRADVISLADRRKRGGIVASLSRPELAVAATFVLLAGAAALFVGTSSKREPAPASMAEAPAAEARASAPAGATATTDVATAVAYAQPPPAAAPVAAPIEPMSDPNAVASKTGHAGASAKARSAPLRDSAFEAAMALYEAGRYAEALPRFRALASSRPEAELYIARCIANTQGCGAAVAHYDRAARANAGSESGSRAALEAAQCASRSGQTTAARTRYQSLTNDVYVGSEAQSELARLDSSGAPAAKAAKPAATTTATAAPRAASPNDALR